MTRKESKEWIPAFARMTKANGEGWPRASEAKGPLPSGKRVGSREKKEKEERRKKKTKVVLNPSAPNTPEGNTLDE